MGLRKEYLTSGQVVIGKVRLLELLAKEKHHDGYLRVAVAMTPRQLEHIELLRQAKDRFSKLEGNYHMGWLDCLNEQNRLLMDELRRAGDAVPFVLNLGGPPVPD